MANARTAVVVKKSPTAAVAVNSEKFIWRTFLKRLSISLDWSCIKKYFYTKFIFVLPEYHYVKKKPHNCEAGWWGTLFLIQFN